MNEPLHWQTHVYIGGAIFQCLESYASITERLRGVEVKMTHMSENGGTMQWIPPIELTVRVQDDLPSRACFNPQAISVVLEILPAYRDEVVEQEQATS